MSDGMGRELAYLSSHATNRNFIPNCGNLIAKRFEHRVGRLAHPLSPEGKGAWGKRWSPL